MPDPLNVELGARTDRLQRDFGEAVKYADAAVGHIEDSFKNANPDAKGLLDRFQANAQEPARHTGEAIGLIIAGAVVAAGAGISTSLFKSIDALSALGDRAEDLRLPVNLLQALSVAATEARIPVKELNSALDEFTKVSKRDEDDASSFYKALGNVSAASVEAWKNATTQADRLRILGEAFRSTTDETKRAQLAQQAFGTDSERITRLFQAGADGFTKYIEQARALGIEINESFVRQAQEAKSQIGLLSRVLTDEFSTATAGLIPIFVRLLPYLEKLVEVSTAISNIFATDETASVAQLKSELSGLVDEWVNLKNQQDEIAKSPPAKELSDFVATGSLSKDFTALKDTLRDVIRDETGLAADTANDLAALDDRIKEIERRAETVRKLIASREAKPAADGAAFKPRPSLKDDASSSRDRFDASADSIEKRTAALEAETRTIDLNTEARERAKIAAQLEAVAMQVNKEAGLGENIVTAEQRQRIDEVAAAYGRAALAIEQARSPLATFARESANLNKQLNQFAASSLNTITDEFANVVTGAKTAADAFKQMATSIINDLARIAIRAAITGPLGGALNSLIGGLNGGGGFPFNFGLTPGHNAGGTDNWPGGPTWVGENGPEILNLPRGSQIVPNDVAKGLGGGLSVQLNVQNYAGADVKSGRTRRNADGSITLDVIIDRAVAKNLGTPGTATSKFMHRGFGLAGGLTAR